jgi:hypothetical protein
MSYSHKELVKTSLVGVSKNPYYIFIGGDVEGSMNLTA